LDQFSELLRDLTRVTSGKRLEDVALKFGHFEPQVVVKGFFEMRQYDLSGQQRVVVRHVRIRKL
jgi:hypothetical protein